VSETHPFLSDEWFEAVTAKIRGHVHHESRAASPDVLLNLVVTGTPFGDRELHMGSHAGDTLFGRGPRDDADLSVTTDYETARSVFVAGDPQAGMQAFMVGKVKVQGDMTKLLAAQAGGGGNPELRDAIQALTS
jgi:hypothetical protein